MARGGSTLEQWIIPHEHEHEHEHRCMEVQRWWIKVHQGAGRCMCMEVHVHRGAKRYMEVHGGAWMFMEVHEVHGGACAQQILGAGAWKWCREVHGGGAWRCTEVHGVAWRFIELH